MVVLLLLPSYFLPSLAKPVNAQEAGPWYNQTYQQWWNKVFKDSSDDEIFGERYTAAQVQWVVYGLISFVLNSTTDPETTSCLMNNDIVDCKNRIVDFLTAAAERDKYLAGEKKGFVAFMLSDRPLSGITYAKNLARKFSLVPEVQAQTGFGFSALDPILPLWRAARNAAYALVVIVTLAMAFMIMFRVKISPQTVISIQSALPKIAVAIILITFSYAIAGLLVDIMYLVIGFLSIVIASGINIMGWQPFQPVGGINGVFGFMTQGFLGAGAFGIVVLYMFLFTVVAFVTFMGANGLGGALTIVTPVLGAILALLVVVIVFIMLIFINLKILWMLLKTFANTLLLVLVAPFQILLGAISPGGGFSTWMRSYLANLAVFPTTGVLFVLSFVFLLMAFLITLKSISLPGLDGFFRQLGLGIPIIGPIVVHQGWPPLLVFPVENSVAVLFVGVSVVILFILPKTVDMIKALVEGKPFAYGTAIGEAFGPIAGPAKFVGAMPGQFISGYVRDLGENKSKELREKVTGGVTAARDASVGRHEAETSRTPRAG